MDSLLTILIILILGIVILSLFFIYEGKWFQKARLGNLIMASEECESIEELANIASEAEELKQEIKGNIQTYYLKTNDELYCDTNFVDTSNMTLGELVTHYAENEKKGNVINIFDN